MAAPVVARIVLAQAGNAPPGGYVDGGRDDLVVGALVTATNADNAGVLGHKWEVTPCAGVSLASYGVAGAESPALTLTPPSPNGFGDVAVRLTVYGAPLANGAPNIATDQVILGIRLDASGYPAGIPIPSEKETSAGGRSTLSPDGGREHRMQEALYAIGKQLVATGAGSTFFIQAEDGPSWSGNAAIKSGSDKALFVGDPVEKTVTLLLSDTIGKVLDQHGHEIATGDVTFASGSDQLGVVVDEDEKTVVISLGDVVTSIAGPDDEPLTGAVALAQGVGVGIVRSGNTLTFNTTGGGGSALPAPYTATVPGSGEYEGGLLITGPGVDAPVTYPPPVVIRGRDNANDGDVTDGNGGDVIVVGGDILAENIGGGAPGNAILRGGTGSSGGGGVVEGGRTLREGGSAGGAYLRGSGAWDHDALTNMNGGGAYVSGGEGKGTGNGGAIEITGGNAGASNGGAITIVGGDGGSGGEVTIRGGSSSGTDVPGADVTIEGGGIGAGYDPGGDGGTVTLKGGDGTQFGGKSRVLGGDGGDEWEGGDVEIYGGSANGTGSEGGDVRIAGGDGQAKGVVRFGYLSAGLFNDRVQIDPVHDRIAMGSSFKIEPRLWSQAGGTAATPWDHVTDLSYESLATAIGDTIGAYRFRYAFSDTSRTPLELQYDRAIVRGALRQEQAASSAIDVVVNNVAITTTSTSGTLIDSLAIANSQAITVTVALQHDDGTTCGRTVYTHTFRRSSGGAVTATGSIVDLSATDKKQGHSVTIANNSGTIEVKVVAASSTSTKHRGQVSWEIASIA